MAKIKCACDPRKATRYPSRDKVKMKDGKPSVERLGFKCSRCGKIIIQVITYATSGGTRIKWEK
jgi:hypothetical protein